MQCQRSIEVTPPRALQDFKLKTALDWMEFCVTLQSPSQFRHIQQRMGEVWGKTHFKPVEGFASSRAFTFRLNDPPGPDQFMRDLQSMAMPGDPPITEQDVVVTGIEIALDAYVQGSDRQALAQAVAYLIRHQANPPAGSPRITAKGLPPIEPESIQDVFEALMQGGITINSGPQGASWTCRFYLKDYDTINGVPYSALPPEQWRARFENTLKGSEVLFTSIGGWRNHRFEQSLADRFALVIPDSTRGPLIASWQNYLIQLGRRPDSPKRRPSDRRQRRPFTLRDTHLNDRIRQALRALTRDQCCQNSVANDPPQLPAPLERLGLAVVVPKYMLLTAGDQCEKQMQSELTASKPPDSPHPQCRPTIDVGPTGCI